MQSCFLSLDSLDERFSYLFPFKNVHAIKMLFLTFAYARRKVKDEYRKILRDGVSIVRKEKKGFFRLFPDSFFKLLTLAAENTSLIH